MASTHRDPWFIQPTSNVRDMFFFKYKYTFNDHQQTMTPYHLACQMCLHAKREFWGFGDVHETDSWQHKVINQHICWLYMQISRHVSYTCRSFFLARFSMLNNLFLNNFSGVPREAMLFNRERILASIFPEMNKTWLFYPKNTSLVFTMNCENPYF